MKTDRLIAKFHSNHEIFARIATYESKDPNDSLFFAKYHKFTHFIPISKLQLDTQWVKGLDQGDESQFLNDTKYLFYRLDFDTIWKRGGKIYFLYRTPSFGSPYRLQGFYFVSDPTIKQVYPIEHAIKNRIPLEERWFYFTADESQI